MQKILKLIDKAIATSAGKPNRLFQLDGWRGISIVCVLAAHLLPLGPKPLKLNATAGAMGMALFFTLSGFLITSFLLKRPQIKPFLIRRLCRILPLAWLFMLITLWVHQESIGAWSANFFFYLNYTDYRQPYNSHIWSLCVEMHFYLFAAVAVAAFGRRGTYLLVVAGLAITAYRIHKGIYIGTATHVRADEIAVGAMLALLLSDESKSRLKPIQKFFSPWLAILLLLLACSPLSGPLQYFRPYIAGLAVGSTLLHPSHVFSRFLDNKYLLYLATISYALYVIHGPLRAGWFTGENTLDRYLVKRPIAIPLTFVLAHLSTFYWEAWWIRFGRSLTSTPRSQAGLTPIPPSRSPSSKA